MSNRAKTEQFITTYIDKIAPGGENKKLYLDMFSAMSDEQFTAFIDGLKTGKTNLCVISPNFSKNKIDIKRNLDIAKELGHNFFQRIWIPAKGSIPSYLTPIPYLVVDLPLRRQAQILEKKISIPEDNNSVDNFTGQPTGKSKGSRMSYPETQVLASLNLKHSLVEFLKYRGGDDKGFNAMNTMIARTGGVKMSAIQAYSGEVKSTVTLRTMLTCMHLRNTL